MITYKSQLSEIDDKIQRAQRRLQLINQIKAKRIAIPSLAGVESYEKHQHLNFSQLNFEDMGMLFGDDKSLDNIAVSKNFIEKNIIDSGSLNPGLSAGSEILKFVFLDTPNFMSDDNESITKVVVCLLADKSLSIYSAMSGKFITNSPLSFSDFNALNEETDLKSSVAGMQATSSGNEFAVIILIKTGNVYIINFELKRLEVLNSGKTQEPKVNQTHNEKMAVRTRSPKTVQIESVVSFNTWDSMAKTNSTLYKDEVAKLIAEGTETVGIEYFGKSLTGNFIVADSKGYFNFFRRAQTQDKPVNSTQEESQFKLFSRVSSGFSSFGEIKRLGMLVLFSSRNQVGFLRAYDGQIAATRCEVGTANIVTMDFDKEILGKFYVGIDTGEIIAFNANTHDKNDIGCEIEGKIMGDLSDNYKLSVLKQFIVRVNPKGDFDVYNVTSAKLNPTMIEYSAVSHVKYKPYYPETDLNQPSVIEIIDDIILAPEGNVVLVRIPGSSTKLMLIEVLGSGVANESFTLMILRNKPILIGVSISLVLLFQFLKSR